MPGNEEARHDSHKTLAPASPAMAHPQSWEYDTKEELLYYSNERKKTTNLRRQLLYQCHYTPLPSSIRTKQTTLRVLRSYTARTSTLRAKLLEETGASSDCRKRPTSNIAAEILWTRQLHDDARWRTLRATPAETRAQPY